MRTISITEELRKKFTLEEVKVAIKSLALKKAVGKDNIPAEVFKENIEEIAPYMQEIVNNILVHNIDLPQEWTKGILCLLWKKESKEKCDNYRPVTLLNVSYKILPKMITKRMSPIMNLLTPELQTAYKKNRSTYDTLKILRTLLNDQDSERTITLMDLTKAFDRTNRQLLFNILIKKEYQ